MIGDLTMTHDIIKGLDIQVEDSVQELLNKNSDEDTDMTSVKHEQFTALLKTRYGYTNEKAAEDVERRLKQFNRMDRASGIPRPRPHFKHPHEK
jgi:hypothetical protein